MNTDAARRQGVLAALGAFVIWGLAPLYFRAVDSVPPFEIVAHRILWSVALLAALLALLPRSGGFAGLRAIRRQPRLLGLLALTSLLTSGNWLLFVWAINAHRLVEAILGYFMTPLVNILFGRLFLGERMRPAQQLAVALACAGVAWQIWQLGRAPWIALFLAATFGTYGLLRKRAPVDAIGGLFVETVIAAPVAAAYIGWLAAQGLLAWGGELQATLLLPFSCVITAVPLMLFAIGARRLPLSTLGFLQYLAPTLGFLIAIFVFREPLDSDRLVSFVLIWIALVIYSADMMRRTRSPA
ncbi:EamA family transporter RarD [Azoarcus sp. TTM-91]|uniref:EamA family transporter RarD n=1 Tax=Azoarcus sp. TTM-91 TaxID=2691581 RepID=UPI001B7D1DC7|nr:EamA family transporter RarD [Azoarcus sp. TTM-91]